MRQCGADKVPIKADDFVKQAGLFIQRELLKDCLPFFRIYQHRRGADVVIMPRRHGLNTPEIAHRKVTPGGEIAEMTGIAARL